MADTQYLVDTVYISGRWAAAGPNRPVKLSRCAAQDRRLVEKIGRRHASS